MDGCDYSSRLAEFWRQLSPRAAVSYALSDAWSVSGSAGLYYQLPPYTALGFKQEGVLVNRSLDYLRVGMLCAGAAEQGMSQWASAFAEASLGVSKTVGDLLGPCGFATMMGLSRALYGRFGAGLDLRRYMSVSSLLCVAAYLLAALALAGDLGCSAGPAAVGFAAEKAGGDLKSGLLLAVIFPAALLPAR